MIIIDKLAYSSGLREKSPVIKLALALMTIVTLLVTRSVIGGILSFGLMGGLTLILGKTSFRYYCKLLLIPLVFIGISGVAILITIDKRIVLEHSVPLYGYYVSTSDADLLRALTVSITAFASVCCLYFLILSTPLTDLIFVFRKLHCPAILIELMLLMYRFVFLILELTMVITTAQSCRLGNTTFKRRMKGMASMLSAVLIKSLRKSRAIYDAMEARGYDGELVVLEPESKIEGKEVVLLFLWEAVLLGIAYISRGWLG